MRLSALCTAVLTYVVVGHPPPAVAQVDPQRAQEYFKEAQALCERDGGRLWGVSICAPMVIGDARTRTFATSQPPPDATRPQLIGLINGPIQWGDGMWAALTWDTIANWPARTRGEAFVHESFHIEIGRATSELQSPCNLVCRLLLEKKNNTIDAETR